MKLHFFVFLIAAFFQLAHLEVKAQPVYIYGQDGQYLGFVAPGSYPVGNTAIFFPAPRRTYPQQSPYSGNSAYENAAELPPLSRGFGRFRQSDCGSSDWQNSGYRSPERHAAENYSNFCNSSRQPGDFESLRHLQSPYALSPSSPGGTSSYEHRWKPGFLNEFSEQRCGF